MNPDDLALLEEQRDFYRRSLVDLDREHAAGDLDDTDLATLRADYQRRLEEVEAELGGGAADLPSAPPRRRSRSVAAVAVVLAVALAAGIAVERTAGSRRLGESASGSIRQTSSGRLAQAAGLASEGKYVEALQAYDAVLESEPRNVEALADRGLLLINLAGLTERPTLLTQGRLSIEKALRIDPHDPRSLFYLGLALKLDDQDAAAEEAFAQALAENPPAALRAKIEAFRKSTATTTVSP